MPDPTKSIESHGGNLALRSVLAGTGNVPDPVNGFTILPGAWSEVCPFGRDPDFNLLFILSAVTSGTIVIEEVLDASATVAGETWDTVVVATERIQHWSAGEALQGFCRVKNNTTANLIAYTSGRLAT